MTPDQRYADLSDILITFILLLVRLSKNDRHQAVCDPEQRYTDLSDILLTFILLFVRLSEMSDTRLSVTPDSITRISLTSC